MTQKYGIAAALFSLKCFLAAMLALYVSLRIGLPRPYWSLTTAYIVAQPLAAAVLSKAVFRVIGTITGAMMAVIMVPRLVNAPELLTLAFAGWLGLCVFVSLMDRTPRSYMFVLAGYSACIIGLPSVGAPEEIFTIASLRVQEITIGILCASLVHGVLFPSSVTDLLMRRVEDILRDAERWSHDSLAQEPVPTLAKERQKLALDITELHQLSTHLPFETKRIAPRVRTVRALQDQLSMALPLAAAVDDRMTVLAREGTTLPPAIVELVDDVRAWLTAMPADRAERGASAAALHARCVALEPVVTGDMDWADAVRLSLLSRLADLIGVHRDCRDLRDQMETHSRHPVTPRVAELIEHRSGREMHRDYAGATRAALSAALTMIVGCALWIGSGWEDGATAVMLAGVFLALFASADDPVAPLKMFMTGTIIAILICGFYAFVILPRVDGFPLLAAVLAPALLIAGAFMAVPRHAALALATMMGLANPSLIAAQYDSEFAPYANGSLAQLLGIVLAIVMVRLLQSAGATGAIRRTVKAGWMDIASRANLAAPPDVRGWINRMLDRAALLAPRLAAQGNEPGSPVYDPLRDLRTGVAIGELRQLRIDLPVAEGAPITPVLRDVGAYYAALDPDQPRGPEAGLLAKIDHAMAALTANPMPDVRRSAALALVSLRRALFPEAPPYRRIAA
ncbi:Uncharacterized membrane protein YccC [Sphingomonas laterariae]|uniref:Uncharacterized membrane protein YccC n=1 Tax=Edaphosphingomonas laterariae TaxID=861865 RepID=A0A239JF99_9SPHN|nr:FUSC family protein [Sphingomonas laterariae]SNT04500.1 Uncharacterized membrane protein YccC [Sphingomonas laterariae]